MKKESNWLFYLITGFAGLIILGTVGFIIYIYVRYGGTPLKDLPAWVLPFFNH